MACLTCLACLACMVYIACVTVQRHLNRMWNAAKPKHRVERLRICVFVARMYLRTPFTIARAYMKWFAWFEQRYMGISFEGVQVIVSRVHGGRKQICIGTRSECRRTAWCFDIGAGGMVASTETPPHAASKELEEELGVKLRMQQVATLMPCDGYSCIILLYRATCDSHDLRSIDGTYTAINWVDANYESIITFMSSAMKVLGSVVLTKRDTMRMFEQRILL
jgi:ADP-ribose pyrophosphatase YjhB (NUDIX family)